MSRASAASAAHPHWRVSVVPAASGVLAVVLIGAGMLARRPEPVLAGLAVAVGLAWAWAGRPDPEEPVPVSIAATGDAVEGGIPVTASVEVPAGTDWVHVRIAVLGSPRVDAVLSPGAARRITGSVPVLHSGPQDLVALGYRAAARDGVEVTDPSEPLTLRGSIPPEHSAIEELPLPRSLTGLAGAHPSSRAGDGGEFRDIRPFAPGDRMRRIDWKATARSGTGRGDLLVRRTDATADATVLIILDSRDDVGEHVADWGRNTAAAKGLSSLDVARSAAGSVAAGYLRAGDRVGFHDLALPARVVAPMAGARHLQRILQAIEHSAPAGPVGVRRRAPAVPAGTMIWVFSTFLDDHAAGLALLWRASGHRVVLVDTMPPPVLAGLTRPQRVAHRIVMMERADRMGAAAAAGAEPLEWPFRDAGARKAALIALARARAPR